jgi:type I restriction enzyme S subunit
MINSSTDKMEANNSLIPELRFPEFINDGDWEEKPLRDLCELVRGPFGGALKKEIFVKEGYAVYEQAHAIYSDFSSFRYRINDEKFSELKRFSVKSDDLIMSCSGTMGKFALIPKDFEKGIINQALLKLTVKKGFDNLFIKISLETEGNQNKLLSQSAGGAIKNVVSVSQIKELGLFVPCLKEQQKIAFCLYSLNEVIATHSQKLEVLKEHKKGLMQNLFPQEGETVPKWRFKEFEEDGEWEEKKLGDCLMQNPEYGINAPAVPFSENLPTYLRITDISVDGRFLSNEKVSVAKDVNENNYLNEGDIVLARTGASVGKSYQYKINDGRLVFAGFLIRVKSDISKLDPGFLFQFLSSNKYWKWVTFISARSGQPGINGTEYSSMPICLPPTLIEQNKIASCLSSLDALITEQAEKIEQLKLHKKGLMQGLFPKIV